MGRFDRNSYGEVSPDRLVFELASKQHGCITRVQLLAAGIPDDSIDYRLRVGRLRQLHRGVLYAGAAPITFDSRMYAALLACGAESAVSHLTAAVLWGFASGPVPVQVSAPRARGRLPGVTVHRPRSLSGDVVINREFRVTSPARTLVDLCAVLSASHVARLCHEAEILRVVTKPEIREVLERSRGRRGINKLRPLVARDDKVTKSQLERRFLRLVIDAGLPAPKTNEHLWIAGREREVDAHWPDVMVAVELDSWEFHRTRERFEADRERDSALIAAGWRTMRFTWRRLRDDPHGVIRDLQRLHHRSGLSSPE